MRVLCVKKRMGKKLLAGLAMGVGLTLPSLAHACKCAPIPREKAIQSTPNVFDGYVLRVREEAGTRYATIEMVRPVKGELPRVIEIATQVSTAACGYAFQKGQRLTVGATLREQQFWSGSCLMHSLNQKPK